MSAHLHAPSRRLPCGCRIKAGEVAPGDTLIKTCRCGLTYHGRVRESVVLSTVLVIDWTPRTLTAPGETS